MHEKELRLALVCYGGVSLAVYMHGITREIWHLVRASEAFHGRRAPGDGVEAVYAGLLEDIAEGGTSVRVLVDILAGASAGGINAIFLADAIATGSSFEPLTDLWLEGADVDRLIDPEVNAFSRFAKAAAVPIAWALSGRGESGERAEVRAKVASFVRARWFAPPFSGPGFTGILLDALTAMRAAPASPPLLPPGHPVDLSVTVTDFHGHPQTLRLNSPAEVLETEHRITLSFRGHAGALAEVPDLAFAARATASFPGAFPPFAIAELDTVLEKRGEAWPGRADFVRAAFPDPLRAERTLLIDGAILANAPFRPAIAALQNRPARREIDRRFVYIDPKPGIRSVRLTSAESEAAPGFFGTIFAALADIPREQPIRDNLEAIEQRSSRIRRTNRIVAAIRPQVESAIAKAFGASFFVLKATPARVRAWRNRAHRVAARQAGFAYAAYGQLKLSRVVEEAVVHICRIAGNPPASDVRRAVWAEIRSRGIAGDDAFTGAGAAKPTIAFLAAFDTGFRIRRLRFLARQIQVRPELRASIDDLIGRFRAAAARVPLEPVPFGEAGEALDRLRDLLGLPELDEATDELIAAAVEALPRAGRKALLVAYLGFPFYDIATFPLVQEDGRDEYDPIKVDRISPDDATALRAGGTATLKGVQFSSFGAFFSRAWRENDYLWGRLHGADRLIDILLSTAGGARTEGEIAALKRSAFRAILAEEKGRLTHIESLFAEIEREIDSGGLDAAPDLREERPCSS
jgi:patatin-related protein